MPTQKPCQHCRDTMGKMQSERFEGASLQIKWTRTDRVRIKTARLSSPIDREPERSTSTHRVSSMEWLH